MYGTVGVLYYILYITEMYIQYCTYSTVLEFRLTLTVKAYDDLSLYLFTVRVGLKSQAVHAPNSHFVFGLGNSCMRQIPTLFLLGNTFCRSTVLYITPYSTVLVQ